jgi:hypothetical protein
MIDNNMEINQIYKYGEDLCKVGLPSGVRIELKNSIV